MKGPKGWDDDHLRHMCKLSTVWAGAILSEGFDPTELAGENLGNVVNCYRILAETFVELQGRAGMKPRLIAAKNEQGVNDES